jgi:hypothetical protein
MALLIPNDKPLKIQKEFAENALTEAYAMDLITMEELEKRLHQIQGAFSNLELSTYLTDLPQDLLMFNQVENTDTDIVGREGNQTTILSSNLISGRKLRHKNINSKIILGEQTFDYSRIILEPGKYYINLTAVLCEAKFIIPPQYAVSSNLRNIVSEIKDKTYKEPDANTPEIIITGKAIFSSVTIQEQNNGFIEKIKQLFLE